MSITHLTSLLQLKQILSERKDGATVIDFHATWCGPCHAIAPTFESLARKHTSVKFLKCDVDAAPDVAQEYGVRAMPTFIFLKGNAKVDQVQGANRGGLEAALEKLTVESPSVGAFQGKGQTLGGSSGSSSSSSASNGGVGLGGIADISPQIKIFLVLIGAYLVLWYLST